jgi:ferric-chelate reductase
LNARTGCIDWFAPQFAEIATAALEDPSLSLYIKFFVTCSCNHEAVQTVIPNSEVTTIKPSIHDLLVPLIDGEHTSTGGLAVASSGPESLVDETRNAVAKIGPSKIAALGGVALHTEVFCL